MYFSVVMKLMINVIVVLSRLVFSVVSLKVDLLEKFDDMIIN